MANSVRGEAPAAELRSRWSWRFRRDGHLLWFAWNLGVLSLTGLACWSLVGAGLAMGSPDRSVPGWSGMPVGQVLQYAVVSALFTTASVGMLVLAGLHAAFVLLELPWQRRLLASRSCRSGQPFLAGCGGRRLRARPNNP